VVTPTTWEPQVFQQHHQLHPQTYHQQMMALQQQQLQRYPASTYTNGSGSGSLSAATPFQPYMSSGTFSHRIIPRTPPASKCPTPQIMASAKPEEAFTTVQGNPASIQEVVPRGNAELDAVSETTFTRVDALIETSEDDEVRKFNRLGRTDLRSSESCQSTLDMELDSLSTPSSSDNELDNEILASVLNTRSNMGSVESILARGAALREIRAPADDGRRVDREWNDTDAYQGGATREEHPSIVEGEDGSGRELPDRAGGHQGSVGSGCEEDIAVEEKDAAPLEGDVVVMNGNGGDDSACVGAISSEESAESDFSGPGGEQVATSDAAAAVRTRIMLKSPHRSPGMAMVSSSPNAMLQPDDRQKELQLLDSKIYAKVEERRSLAKTPGPSSREEEGSGSGYWNSDSRITSDSLEDSLEDAVKGSTNGVEEVVKGGGCGDSLEAKLNSLKLKK